MPPKSADAKKPTGGVRGVSAEEKSRRMLEIFKSAEVYSLKELEKLGVKKGVLSQSIPDIVKGLVDEGLVDMDKIGGGNFYWALPSKQGQRRKARLEQLQADLTAAQGVVARERTKMEQLGEERQATAERATNLKKLDELKLLQAELREKLKHYEDRDPTVLKALGEQVNFAMDHACRWGLNLLRIRDYVQTETGLDTETFDGRYQVSLSDLEPITWANYKDFLPSDAAPLVRKSLDEGFGDEFGLETKAASDDEKNEAAGAAPPPATVAKAPVSLGFGSAAQGAPAVNGAAKVASSALPKGSKEAQQPQAAVNAAAPKKAAKKAAPKKAAAAEKKDSTKKEGSTDNEGSARKETSAVVAQTGQGAGKGKNTQKPREKKPAEKKDKSAPKKKPAEKKDNEILPAVGAGDDDDEDFAPTAKKAKR